MLEVGREATADFVSANFPNAETVSKGYADRQYRRFIAIDNSLYVVVYDYKAKTSNVIYQREVKEDVKEAV
jgi:hypothetical protein